MNDILNHCRKIIIVFSKSDLNPVTSDVNMQCEKIFVSSKTGAGIEELKTRIYNTACDNSSINEGLNVSVRQLEEIRGCLEALKECESCHDEDIIAGMLNSSRAALLRVLGVDAGDELLDSMFNRFCVGK